MLHLPVAMMRHLSLHVLGGGAGELQGGGLHVLTNAAGVVVGLGAALVHLRTEREGEPP